jgi:pimeloyl-[acyl-carrier protein] methyl ester esterase
VLMPGMDGTGDMFAPLVRAITTSALATKIHILRYPRHQALNYAELIEFALTQLPNAPCAVIAESFSGPIAIELAARFPSQIERVVLSTSFVRNPLPWLAMLAPMLDFLPIAHAPDWLMEQQLFNADATPELKSALARATGSVSPAVMRARLKAILNVDASKRLSQLSQPVLYLQADADRIVPDRCAQEVKGALASASICRLAGPHCLLQIAPAQAWQEIQAWLQTTNS